MKKIKEMISKFLAYLANENEKTYGDKPLDCCKLNVENQEKANR